jgi:hypothetical protein
MLLPLFFKKIDHSKDYVGVAHQEQNITLNQAGLALELI